MDACCVLTVIEWLVRKGETPNFCLECGQALNARGMDARLIRRLIYKNVPYIEEV